MIPNNEEWYYINYYFFNYFHTFKTETKLESHRKVCENKDFCNAVMPSEDTKILVFNQYRISDKTLFIIYADLES